MACSCGPYWATNAGSALVAPLRFDARGASIASGSVIPKSIWLSSVCRTVMMMVAPPGEPMASTPRAAVLDDDRGRHRAARPLVGLNRVRRPRGEVEAGELVVEQEPPMGQQDAFIASPTVRPPLEDGGIP